MPTLSIPLRGLPTDVAKPVELTPLPEPRDFAAGGMLAKRQRLFSLLKDACADFTPCDECDRADARGGGYRF